MDNLFRGRLWITDEKVSFDNGSEGGFGRVSCSVGVTLYVVIAESLFQALGILLLPQNIPTSLKLLTTMVDDIWHYAGDQSTDVSAPLSSKGGVQRYSIVI